MAVAALWAGAAGAQSHPPSGREASTLRQRHLRPVGGPSGCSRARGAKSRASGAWEAWRREAAGCRIGMEPYCARPARAAKVPALPALQWSQAAVTGAQQVQVMMLEVVGSHKRRMHLTRDHFETCTQDKTMLHAPHSLEKLPPSALRWRRQIPREYDWNQASILCPR